MEFKYHRTPRSPLPTHAEVNDGPVLTMPDLALTPQEILVKFAKGDNVPWQDENVDDFSKYEIEETYQKYQQLQAEVNQMKTRINKYEKTISEDILNKDIEKKVQQKFDKEKAVKPQTAL